MSSVSPSALNAFHQCPFKWKLSMQSEKKIKTDERFLLLGRLIHEVIAIYFERIGNKPKLNDIEKTVNSIFQEKWTNNLNSLKSRANRCIKNFISFEKRRLKTAFDNNTVFNSPNVLLEQKFSEGRIRAIVDYYSPETKTLIDWKTGKSNQLNTGLKRQGKIYEMVLRAKGYEVNTVQFVMLYSGVTITLPQISDAWIDNEIKKMDDLIQHNKFPRNRTPLCGWCEFQLRCDLNKTCLWNV